MVTGEAVPIDLRIARVGSRMIAGFIDLAVGVALLVGLIVLLELVSGGVDSGLGAALAIVFALSAFLVYPVACETLWRGRTLGKAAMGLRVTRDDGGPPRFRHAFVRGLVGLVVERPGPLFALPAVVSMTVSARGKRLGDVFAGTIVIQERVPKTRAFTPSMPPGLEGWAALLDLSRFDDRLALAVRGFLARAPDLSESARARLGDDLCVAVAAVVTPQAPPGTPGWAYLGAVLAERTRRARERLGAPAWNAARPAVPTAVWTAPTSPPVTTVVPIPAPTPGPAGPGPAE
ncbi:MAG: RDD family protein, partial [Frankia sp.]